MMRRGVVWESFRRGSDVATTPTATPGGSGKLQVGANSPAAYLSSCRTYGYAPAGWMRCPRAANGKEAE